MNGQITTLPGFADALATSVCANPNTRLNNMAMLRALNAKSMPEIINKEHMRQATLAYKGVLDVICRAELGTLSKGLDPMMDPTLTYERFQAALSEVKKHLLILNS